MIRLQWLTKKNLAKAFPRNTPGAAAKQQIFTIYTPDVSQILLYIVEMPSFTTASGFAVCHLRTSAGMPFRQAPGTFS